jgi:hypothetical protein
MEISVQQHNGTSERVNRILRVQRAGIAVEKALREMNQDTFAFLRFARERKLLEKLPKRFIQRLFLELEVLQVFVSYHATKLVTEK